MSFQRKYRYSGTVRRVCRRTPRSGVHARVWIAGHGRTWGVSAAPSPASKSRAARLTWSRPTGGDCPIGASKTARAGPAPPVPPVLSGRDQASATPSIAMSHPLTGADAGKSTIRTWQLHDYLFVRPRRDQRQTGRLRESHRGAPFIRSARLLPSFCINVLSAIPEIAARRQVMGVIRCHLRPKGRFYTR